MIEVCEKPVREWIEKAAKLRFVERIWAKDAALWTRDVEGQKEIRNRLGWLAAPQTMKGAAAELAAFAEEIRAEFDRVALLGMGGSSLAPEVFRNVFGVKAGFPKLVVLDSTDPERIRDVEAGLDLSKTLFIVSSKSGGTIELVSLYKYFFEKIKALKGDEAGRQFVAITDPATPLEALAKERGFRRVFLNPEDVGGRFSALTYFGLVPASLIGIDVSKVLAGAERMARACSPGTPAAENPGLSLGTGIAVLAESGRDKLTILAPKALASFGDWAEQLVAESTGKEDLGIVPVVGEPFARPEEYGGDRSFAALLLDGADNAEVEALARGLEKAGHPVFTLRLKEAADLGAEFFRWEMATAVACALLKVNVFDQPDVQAAKDGTNAILKKAVSGAKVAPRPESAAGPILSEAAPGDYVGILAFLPDRDLVRKTLDEIQREIRARSGKAVTLGIGPRYLHSTGQLHKGGANNGIFLVITVAHENDLMIPGEPFSFAELELAQAMGDLEALEKRGRRVFHFRLPGLSEKDLADLAARIKDRL
jgi:glucose-6-phosphate isomerase